MCVLHTILEQNITCTLACTCSTTCTYSVVPLHVVYTCTYTLNYFPPTVVIHYALGISRFQGVVYKAALIVLTTYKVHGLR